MNAVAREMFQVPSCADVRTAVWGAMRDMVKLGCWDAYTDSIEVRLQVEADGWRVLWGDPSFDQDHRGHWGASSVDCASRTFDDAAVIACELIDQVEESIACELIDQVEESISESR